MPCQVGYRDRHVTISHLCLMYVIESASALCQIAPHSEFIRRCVAHWDRSVASSGNNLLDLDLDRLITDVAQADEMQRFLRSLRDWVAEHSRLELPDGRAVTWVEQVLSLFTPSPDGPRST